MSAEMRPSRFADIVMLCPAEPCKTALECLVRVARHHGFDVPTDHPARS